MLVQSFGSACMNDAAAEAAALQAEAAAAETRARSMAARKMWLTRIAIAVGIAALLWIGWYILVGRNYVSTDNAYVNAEIAQVTPLIAGTVTEVRVKDTQMVRRGDILVVLDPANARIAVAQAEAELAEAARGFRKTVATNDALSAEVSSREASIAQARAQLAAAQADAQKAGADLRRRQELAKEGIVSAEDLTAARKADIAAEAGVVTARAAIAQAEANRSRNAPCAIARATLEDISRRIGARSLFATHYLELTTLAGELPDVVNVHVGALEREGRVVFLYAIRPGAADRAYGVQVARLAGLPPWVADRAEALLAAMPRPEAARTVSPRRIAEESELPRDPEVPAAHEEDPSPAERLAVALSGLDLNEMTPREALEWLWEQQERLGASDRE